MGISIPGPALKKHPALHRFFIHLVEKDAVAIRLGPSRITMLEITIHLENGTISSEARKVPIPSARIPGLQGANTLTHSAESLPTTMS